MRSATLFLLAFVTMMAWGCGQATAPAPAAASIQGPATLTMETHWSETQAICLADPAGTSRFDQQIRSAQKRVKALPRTPDGWIMLGRSWIQKARLTSDPGFYVNVDACANEILRLNPESTGGLELQALVMMNNHQFREADYIAQMTLKKDPANLIALGIRSDALLELGQFEDSANATQEMMDLHPDMSSYSRASYLRWLKGDFTGAKEFIREALDGRDTRDPESAAWTFVQAGMLYWHEGDYESADAIFAEAMRWVPDYPPALVARGRAALGLNHPADAVKFLKRAYSIHPLPETAWMLGDALALTGDQKGADENYQKVIHEGRRTDRLTLAYFYASKNRNLEEALQLIEEERKNRGNIYVDDTYAWVLYRLGRFAEARKTIDHGLRLGTRDARLLYHAGVIRLASGDPAGRRWIQRALALNPQFDATALVDRELTKRDKVSAISEAGCSAGGTPADSLWPRTMLTRSKASETPARQAPL